VESKPAGVGFHDRSVPDALRSSWRSRVRAILGTGLPPGFEVVRGRRVVEIRLTGWSKGTIVATRPGRRRGEGLDRSLLAIGDDTTDEDMFRAIRGEGLGVLVAPRLRRSAATRRLGSPRQVGKFLALLAASMR
jgi:trehalose-phosphatase